MKGVTKSAKQANMRSRKCAACAILKKCTPDIHRACSDSFIEGYKKGAEFSKRQQKEDKQ